MEQSSYSQPIGQSSPNAKPPDENLLSLGIGAASGDPAAMGTAFYHTIKAVQDQVTAVNKLERRIAERELEQKNAATSRAVTLPFAYDPAKGVQRINLGRILKQRVNAISLITAQTAEPLSADPRDKIIYLNFDYEIHVPSATGAAFPRAEYPAPDSFELFIPNGGKLNQFAAVRDMDTLAIYARQAFIGTVFITAGSPSVLPGL